MSGDESTPEQNNDLKSVLASIQQRLSAIELQLAENGAQKQAANGHEHGNVNHDNSAIQQAENAHEYDEKTVSTTNTTAEKVNEPSVIPDIQKEFSVVRDAVSRVQLDSSMKLCEGPCPTGTSNKTERSLYYTLQKSSRYVETELKILQLAYAEYDKSHSVDPGYLDQLAVVAKAHLDYNQREYEAVLVASQFDEDTSKLFRNFQKNNACFSEKRVSQLKLAAELSAISRKGTGSASARPRSSPRGRGYFGQRSFGSYGRGGHRGGRSDMFHSLASNYPPHQPQYNGGDN